MPLLRARLRRRRLTEGSPADRVTGAWLEMLDGLRMAGKPALPQLAATEVVGFAAAAAGGRAHGPDRGGIRPPAPQIDELAVLANAVTFGPPERAPDHVGEEQARRAAAQAIAYVAELRARKPWWRRLLWTADPRPLRWATSRSRAATTPPK